MTSCLLVINAGSSSIKASAFAPGNLANLGHWQADLLASTPVWTGSGPAEPMPDTSPSRSIGALALILARADLVPALVGHRIVHGGTVFVRPAEITDTVLTELDAIAPMAPLHNPPALAILRAARGLFPHSRQVAMFDTAFHATIPPVNYRYALPREWEERKGIRRFGFHGFSHAWSSCKAREILGEARAKRVVVLHLGQGCSATAVLDGRSHATTMGFTPLDGLPMGTRSGSVDPGALLHLLARGDLGLADLHKGLWRESGWLALSGVSADFRQVMQAAGNGNAEAAFAVDYLAARSREVVASLAAAMGGIDALVFTGGIGEHCEPLRSRVAGGLGFLNIPPESILVIPAEEERQMAVEMMAMR
jgi:acetate kinase